MRQGLPSSASSHLTQGASLMSMSTASAALAFKPEQIGQLITVPVQKGSIALQVATVIHTDPSHKFRVPIVAADPAAAWTAEGADITASDAVLDEAVAEYKKLAGLTIITSELADDSSPEAAGIVGAGLARDIARKIDAAFFGTNVTDEGPPPVVNANQPAGLEDLANVNAITGPADWANVDPFTEAVYEAESVGATVNAFIAHPADALALAQVKETTGSNRDLLQPDPTLPGVRRVAGVPLLVSPAVTEGTIWGIPTALSLVALRKDVTLDVDRSAYFASDRVGIRATLRVGWVFPHEAAIQKISLTPAG
ncbi:phage major capsid protein [Ruicaihuangia caeni]|uniref:Phage major capsid protein n=1 Tax=Ruicaihuangia caeni TaxID=3042517 RepID=A0AAW6T888_9MICO|nr:phage major capsid protein [Klugiella sp. YN-L-19]MDI2097998.1 phage major capsid protein [Klugiella sp. YN-L-19]